MARRRSGTEEFLGDIVEALKAYGGAAHRSLIVERVAVCRDRRGDPRPSEIDVMQVFERHRDGSGAGLFCLPFGEGSHRWALKGALPLH